MNIKEKMEAEATSARNSFQFGAAAQWEEYKTAWSLYPQIRNIDDIKPGYVIWDIGGPGTLIYIWNTYPRFSDTLEVGCSLVYICDGVPTVRHNAPWSIAVKLAANGAYRLISIVSAPVDRTRKDYCHACNNENLYWQAMAAKCNSCHAVILGG